MYYIQPRYIVYIYVYIYIYIIYMKTVNVKTTSVLISILLHTEECVYRAVSKRCLFSLRVKKKKNSHCIQKKKVNKDTTIVLEFCSPWILTRFSWERVQALGAGSGTGMSCQGEKPLLPCHSCVASDEGTRVRQVTHPDTQEDPGCSSSCHHRFPRTYHSWT